MAFFNRGFSNQNMNQMMSMPIGGMMSSRFGGGMFGGGSRPIQQQAPMPTALPVAHSATPIGQHAMGPQGTIPTGPQGLHPVGPQGQQFANQQALAAQQAAEQKRLADALRAQQEAEASAQVQSQDSDFYNF